MTKIFNCLYFYLLILLSTPSLASKPVDYIYIDANEGSASGGHVAIRFDNDVYHYQYVSPGLIKLDKQKVNDFEFKYRFLENRSLYLSQLAVPDQTYTHLRDHFDLRFQIQKQHYALVAELQREKMLFQFLSGQSVKNPELLQISGAGLFFSPQDFSDNSKLIPQLSDNENLQGMRKKIQIRLGEGYIKRRLQELTQKIQQMQLTGWEKQSAQLQIKEFSALPYTFTQRYLDAAVAWLALNVIQQNRPLRNDVYKTSNRDEFVLSSAQISAMERLSGKLQENTLSLLQSTRPDWGKALLINLGRLAVLDKSIQQRRLLVLDRINKNSFMEESYRPRKKEELDSLFKDALKGINQAKNKLVKQGNEVSYSHLEWQGNRLLELEKARQQPNDIHLSGIKRIPDTPLALPKTIKPRLSNKQIKVGLQGLQHFSEAYQVELDKLYRYDLVRRNCVTELLATIAQATSQQPSGKMITSPHFIPFMSYQVVQNQFPIIEQRVLASYRLQQMQKLYAEKNKAGVFLRESNAFSSSLYKINLADSFFVFFTDETLLLRPLYGAVNTVAGLSQSIFGLFSLPFDSGQRLKLGVRGLLMSLPELVFFNMRKGSFKYLPYSKMLGADETIVRKEDGRKS